MAKTLEFYRLRGRNPRFTTKLNPFAKGMYLTHQIIPEGYAKAMVNYDIDDTGSFITPRAGRKQVDALFYSSKKLGPVSLTDYLYSYNTAQIEVESVEDVVMSLGQYVVMSDLIENNLTNYNVPVFLASMTEKIDPNIYDYDDQNNEWVTSDNLPIETKEYDEFWTLLYDKDDKKFKKITNDDIGLIGARTVKNAYAFDKAVSNNIGRPIYTVLNNELITFAGPEIIYNHYTGSSERSSIENVGDPQLCKLMLYNSGNTPLDTAESKIHIKRQPLEPKELNPIEAYTTGYNMLSATPYRFTNEEGGAPAILGVIPYNLTDNEKPVLNYNVGEPMRLRVYYQYPNTTDTLKIKVEARDDTKTGATFETLINWTTTFVGSNDALFLNYTPKSEKTTVRVTIRKGDDTATESPYLVPLTCNEFPNHELHTFNLKQCKGLVTWQGCVGIYGVAGATDTIFFSDFNDPSYFPYPYNTLSFDNEILAVHSYLDNILVITVDSIWIVTPGTTIQTSRQKKLLNNLHIPEIDAINFVVLKDNIFFKTDYDFYVLKPNMYTSDATDLKNFINSISISQYTRSFTKETIDLLNQVYKPVWQQFTKERRKRIAFEDFSVRDIRSIVKDDEVHYVYNIVPKLTDNIVLDDLNVHLVYNTITRSWRLYFVPKGVSEIRYNPVYYRNKQSGTFNEFFCKSTDVFSSIIVTEQSENSVSDCMFGMLPVENWDSPYYNNYPYLDTGNIALDDTATKRFREVQFNLMNMEPLKIKFFVDFKLDGMERVHATHHEVQHITDEDDPDYGKIFVTPIESPNMELVGETVLADTVDNVYYDGDSYFEVDKSKFPKLDVITVRFELLGRGRRGAVQILNTSLQKYQLSDINWVYRIMNAR